MAPGMAITPGPRRPRRRRLRPILLLAAGLVLPTVLAITLVIYGQYDGARMSAEARAVAQAQAALDHTRHMLMAGRRLLGEVDLVLRRPDADLARPLTGDMLDGLMRATPQVRSLAVYANDGRPVLTRGRALLTDLQHLPDLVRWGDARLGLATGSVPGAQVGRLLMTRRLTGADGSDRGTLVIELDPDALQSHLDAVAGRSGIETVLLFGTDRVLAASAGTGLPADGLSRLHSPLAAMLLDPGQGLDRRLTPDGPSFFVGVARQPGLPLAGVGLLPVAPVVSAFGVNAGLLVVTLLTSLVVGLALARHVLGARAAQERIASLLADTSDAVADGIAIFSPDGRLEVANLAFSAMFCDLHDILNPGCSFAALMEAAARREVIVLPPEPHLRAAQLDQIRTDFARGSLSRILPARGQRALQVTQKRTPSGRSVLTVADVTEMSRRESLLGDFARRNRMLALAVDAVPVGIAITKPGPGGNPFTYANAAFAQLTGYSLNELLGRGLNLLEGRETDAEMVAALSDAIAAGRPGTFELRHHRKSGSAFWNELRVGPLFDEAGTVELVVMICSDVTERKQRLAMQQQAGKLEALGQLAGGVAHDFNNLLSIIEGYARLARKALARETDEAALLDPVIEAAARGARLTQELLAFARRKGHEPSVCDLAETVRRQETILRPLLGGAYPLRLRIDLPRAPVRISADLVGQCLINLVINARDAMPEGGSVDVRLLSVEAQDLPRKFADQPGLSARYVLLSVRDSGQGMSPDMLDHIFEPFFTTKDPGRGTGLGLPLVFGTVTEAGGFIDVTTSPGKGTQMSLYFPLAEVGSEPLTAAGAAPLPAPSGFKGLTALAVEDEVPLLALLSHHLGDLGFSVLTARNGHEGLSALDAHDGPVDLIVSDLVMPEMSGQRFAELARTLRPDAAIMFVSGHPGRGAVAQGPALPEDAVLLAKPFQPDELARAAAECLARHRERDAA